VCVGPATKLISILQEAPKTYIAEFRLGERSDTDDSTGTVEAVPLAAPVEEQQLKAALATFVGRIDQVPPPYSAVKVKGRRAYALARAGQQLDLTSKSVDVYSIQVLSYEWPVLSLKIECGSGTYIRSIARDLGQQLGCGGLMSALQRSAIGQFHVDDAIAPDLLNLENLNKHLVNPMRIVQHLVQYRCSPQELELLKTGRNWPVNADRLLAAQASRARVAQTETVSGLSPVVITDSAGDHLLALGELQNQNTVLQPRTVFPLN
jgi:tRNA pseudouridine55 synthase